MTAQEVHVTDADKDAEERALATIDLDVMGTQIENYGARSYVRELAERLVMLHPSAKEVGRTGMLTVAQLAMLIGASPLPGTNEIHVWMNRGRIQASLGINYFRRRSRELGGVLYRIRPRAMTGPEREQYGINNGQLAAICEAVRKSDMMELTAAGFTVQDVYDQAGVYGVGTVNEGATAKTGRPLIWTAQKAAEIDALRSLFPNLERPPEDTPRWVEQIDAAYGSPSLNEKTEHFTEEHRDALNEYMRGDDDFEGFDTPPETVDAETGEIVDDDQPPLFDEDDLPWLPESVELENNDLDPKAITEKMSAMWKYVNEQTGDYYPDIEAMVEAIRQELGNPAWQSPHQSNTVGWREAMNTATSHAQKAGA